MPGHAPSVHKKRKVFGFDVSVKLCYLSRPMADSKHIHHSIDYIEFGVRDMKETQDFYTAAFGWSFTNYGDSYAGIQGEGKEMGGLSTEAEVRSGGPLVVLFSEDIDSTLTKVREAGASIVKEIFTFPGGRRFHFADPSGNELAVWTLSSD